MTSRDVGPRFSVIVPAFNAADTIDACLRALLDQTLSQSEYEVVVVDDGSSDKTANLAANYPVTVLRQAHAGPANARNLGARAASGEYLLFTDADCTPAREWMERIVAPLIADATVGGSKGVCSTGQRSLMARFSQVELEVKYERLRRVKEVDFLDTYSAAIRRDAFWQAGGFDSSFTAASNEDTRLSFDLVAKGWRLVFVPNATVGHRQPDTLARYLSRKVRHGFWRVPVYRKHPGKVVGDSYTPVSMQAQFVLALCTGLMLLPSRRRWGAAALGAFAATAVPFTRRTWRQGRDVAIAAPAILYLRSLALAAGLAGGAIAAIWRRIC